MTAERGPGQRAGLSRAAVLDAATELIRQGGVDALTMRALARRLGVAPNALYSHVADKTQLLDDVLDDLLSAVAVPPVDGGDPIPALGALLESSYDLLTSHPSLVPLFLARQGARGPNAVRLGEVMDQLLSRAGLSGPAVDEARLVLIIHTIGSAAFASGPPVAPGGERPLAAAESRRVFDHSLRWLLAGIMQGL